MAAMAVAPQLTAAIQAAQSQGVRVGVSVLDTATGQAYEAGDAEGMFPAESVVKVLIAARLLVDGQLTGDTAALAWKMITQSDDDAANSLWGLVGGPAVVQWAAQRYGITDLGQAPLSASWWGNTKLTARGLTEFYAAIKADSVVGPWLISAMSQLADVGSDGTNQTFGLPTADPQGAFKQGWGGDDDAFNSESLNSTGLVAGRYAVAIFTQHIPYVPMQNLVPLITAIAAPIVTALHAPPPQPAGTQPAGTPPAGTPPAAGSSPQTSASTATNATPEAAMGIGNTALGSQHDRSIAVEEVPLLGGALALVGLVVLLLGKHTSWLHRN